MSKDINRRDFLKTAGGIGLASMISGASAMAADQNKPAPKTKAADPNEAKYPQVPRRKLGKTGVEVPILNLGCIFDTGENQILMKKCVDWGVTYFDTANGYLNGNSELGIGKFIAKNQDKRAKLFIVTKTSGAQSVEDMQAKLEESLKRLQTPYVDMLFYHGADDPALLTDEVKAFAQRCKDKGLIKFYGFSTHSNMAKCMMGASKLNWIDAVMTTYNFREMQKQEMKDAVAACKDAGTGLIAMKSQATGPIKADDKQFVDHFLSRGFTEAQAKLKAVWANDAFATVCCKTTNLKQLAENVAASLDKTKLVQSDFEFMKDYAQATCSGYCGGCSEICENAAEQSPIRDMMRFVMYHDNYGEVEYARNEFASLDPAIRQRLCDIDYSKAEALCPNKLPIAKIIKDGFNKLA